MADVKERIRKLLSLAKSPNENEAKAALLKAKEIMAKHKMTEADLEDLKNQKFLSFVCEDVRWTTDSGRIWMADLCSLIADEYLCVAAWGTKPGTRTHVLHLSGMEEDLEVCKSVMGYAVGFVEGKIEYLQKVNSVIDKKSIANSYAKGFIEGLKIAFENQKEEHPEWGLVVVKPEKVKKYEDSLGSRSIKSKQSDFDVMSYLRGQTDGMKFNARKVIE